MDNKARQNIRHNYIFNMLDGGFFGFAIGFASFSTILPLFFSSMTSSAVLIGMIPAIHNMGWQLPQLLIARHITGLPRYKPLTLLLTIQERLPFLGLAVLAYFLPQIGPRAGLAIGFFLLIWQGLGAGLTANPWQNFIGRVIPPDMRGTFFGMQSAAANLLASGGAIAAGIILNRLPSYTNFALCFAICFSLMVLSWIFLSQTREPQLSTESLPLIERPFWNNVSLILHSDSNFRWFLATRMLLQIGLMASAFFTVYAVRRHGMNELTAGVMTSVLLITQTAANPILGRIADRWSHRNMLALGALATGLSALVAWLAPSLDWFYLVFVLSGIGATAYWTIGMAVTLEFGKEEERPTYIGLANTLIAPATILAPFLGGLLADSAGYGSAFVLAGLSSLITFWILIRRVSDPRDRSTAR